MADLIALHRGVLDTSVAIVSQVGLDDLGRPTPCTDWTLGELLAHMIGQNYGFAAAAQDGHQDASAFAPRPVGQSPSADYEASATAVLDAFAAPGLREASMYLPEVRGGMTLPASTVVGVHLVDYIAHSWDVARSLDVTPVFDPAALAVALKVAKAVPAESKSIDAREPFRPEVATESTSLLDQVISSLGREPTWAPPASVSG